MAITVIVPARYGSSRFPGKPLVNILGWPMIRHVMDRAGKAAGVEAVYAATDDRRIAEAVESFGGRALMITQPMRSGSDRVRAAADELGLGPDELVVNVQGDQPLLPPEIISRTAAPLLDDPDLGMTTPVVEITRPEEIGDPHHVKVVMNRDGDALYFSRASVPHSRDGGPAPYYKHLGVYVYRKRFLDRFADLPTGELEQVESLEQLRALEFGLKVRCVVTAFDSPEVDRPEDAARVAAILQQDSPDW